VNNPGETLAKADVKKVLADPNYERYEKDLEQWESTGAGQEPDERDYPYTPTEDTQAFLSDLMQLDEPEEVLELATETSAASVKKDLAKTQNALRLADQYAAFGDDPYAAKEVLRVAIESGDLSQVEAFPKAKDLAQQLKGIDSGDFDEVMELFEYSPKELAGYDDARDDLKQVAANPDARKAFNKYTKWDPEAELDQASDGYSRDELERRERTLLAASHPELRKTLKTMQTIGTEDANGERPYNWIMDQLWKAQEAKNTRADAFLQGYLDVMHNRFDQRGQGVACGNGWIPRGKQCSPEKARQTPRAALDRTVEKSKARAELKRAVKEGKGQKARVKPKPVESATAGETKTVKDKRLGKQVTKVLMSDGSEVQFDQKFPDKIAKPLAEIHARKLSGESIAPQDLASTLLGGRFNASTKEANLFLEQSRELGIPSDSLWVGEGPHKKSAIDVQADQNLRNAKQGDIEKRIKQLNAEAESYSAKGAERAKRGRTRGAGAGGFNRDLDRIKIGRDIAEGEIERLQAELDRRANRTDSYLQGYLEVMSWRFDRKGEGVACGRGWISRRKKCGRDKSRTTTPEAKARTVEKQKVRQQLRGQVKASQGQKPYVKPKPEPDTPKRYPRRLPKDHVVTTNKRITAARLDAALDAIDSPGAKERVGMFRAFVAKTGIQTVFADPDATNAAHLAVVERGLKDQRYAAEDGGLLRNTKADPTAAGYTTFAWNHVVITSDSRGRDGPFAASSEKLRQGADRIFEANAEDELARDIMAFPSSVKASMRHRDSSEMMTYIHEIGHQVHAKAGLPPVPTTIKGSATNYGAENEEEWFAEHFALWMLDAPRYEQLDPAGAQFIQDSLTRAIKKPVSIEELMARGNS
jgi:hypothetical protein